MEIKDNIIRINGDKTNIEIDFKDKSNIKKIFKTEQPSLLQVVKFLNDETFIDEPNNKVKTNKK